MENNGYRCCNTASPVAVLPVAVRVLRVSRVFRRFWSRGFEWDEKPVVPADARVCGRRAGTHEHRPVVLGPRFRGDDQAGATARHLQNLTMSNSPSCSRARISASGLCLFASLTPDRGVGGAPRDVGVLSGTPVGVHVTRHARHLARRLASHDAGRTPPGAPPWRFWAVRVPRFSVTGIRLGSRFGGHPDPSQRAPRSQVVVPDGRGPYLPGQRLQAAAAGRHTSLRIQDASRTRP